LSRGPGDPPLINSTGMDNLAGGGQCCGHDDYERGEGCQVVTGTGATEVGWLSGGHRRRPPSPTIPSPCWKHVVSLVPGLGVHLLRGWRVYADHWKRGRCGFPRPIGQAILIANPRVFACGALRAPPSSLTPETQRSSISGFHKFWLFLNFVGGLLICCVKVCKLHPFLLRIISSRWRLTQPLQHLLRGNRNLPIPIWFHASAAKLGLLHWFVSQFVSSCGSLLFGASILF